MEELYAQLQPERAANVYTVYAYDLDSDKYGAQLYDIQTQKLLLENGATMRVGLEDSSHNGQPTSGSKVNSFRYRLRATEPKPNSSSTAADVPDVTDHAVVPKSAPSSSTVNSEM